MNPVPSAKLSPWAIFLLLHCQVNITNAVNLTITIGGQTYQCGANYSPYYLGVDVCTVGFPDTARAHRVFADYAFFRNDSYLLVENRNNMRSFPEHHLQKLLWNELAQKPMSTTNHLDGEIRIYRNVSLASTIVGEPNILGCIWDHLLLNLELESLDYYMDTDEVPKLFNIHPMGTVCYLPNLLSLVKKSFHGMINKERSTETSVYSKHITFVDPHLPFWKFAGELCGYDVQGAIPPLANYCGDPHFLALYNLMKVRVNDSPRTFLEAVSLFSLIPSLPAGKKKMWKRYLEYRGIENALDIPYPVAFYDKTLPPLLPFFAPGEADSQKEGIKIDLGDNNSQQIGESQEPMISEINSDESDSEEGILQQDIIPSQLPKGLSAGKATLKSLARVAQFSKQKSRRLPRQGSHTGMDMSSPGTKHLTRSLNVFTTAGTKVVDRSEASEEAKGGKGAKMSEQTDEELLEKEKHIKTKKEQISEKKEKSEKSEKSEKDKTKQLMDKALKKVTILTLRRFVLKDEKYITLSSSSDKDTFAALHNAFEKSLEPMNDMLRDCIEEPLTANQALKQLMVFFAKDVHAENDPSKRPAIESKRIFHELVYTEKPLPPMVNPITMSQNFDAHIEQVATKSSAICLGDNIGKVLETLGKVQFAYHQLLHFYFRETIAKNVIAHYKAVEVPKIPNESQAFAALSPSLIIDQFFKVMDKPEIKKWNEQTRQKEGNKEETSLIDILSSIGELYQGLDELENTIHPMGEELINAQGKEHFRDEPNKQQLQDVKPLRLATIKRHFVEQQKPRMLAIEIMKQFLNKHDLDQTLYILIKQLSIHARSPFPPHSSANPSQETKDAIKKAKAGNSASLLNHLSDNHLMTILSFLVAHKSFCERDKIRNETVILHFKPDSGVEALNEDLLAILIAVKWGEKEPFFFEFPHAAGLMRKYLTDSGVKPDYAQLERLFPECCAALNDISLKTRIATENDVQNRKIPLEEEVFYAANELAAKLISWRASLSLITERANSLSSF